MASQRALKSLVKLLLPHRLQLRLRRFVLARRVAHGASDVEEELAPVRAFLSPGDVAFDVGANAGVFAVGMARAVGPEGRIFAFEPIPDTYDVLVDVVRLSSLRNIDAFCLGASDHSGHTNFVIPEAAAFSGYYLAHVATGDDSGHRVEARLETLDGLLAQGKILPPSFIKCDVEGHELAVLRGACNLIEQHVPNWYMEVARGTSEGVFEFLLSRGYSCAVWTSGRFIQTSSFMDGTCNYFFAHPDNPRTATAGLPGATA